MPSARRLMVAIDGSDQSSTALKWACRNLVGSSELHLVTVLPPMAYRCANSAAQRVQQSPMPINYEAICRSVYPVAPVATAAAVAAVANQWEVGAAADVNFCVTRHLLSTTNSSLQTQKRHDEMHATNLLKDAAQVAIGEHVSAAPCTLQAQISTGKEWSHAIATASTDKLIIPPVLAGRPEPAACSQPTSSRRGIR